MRSSDLAQLAGVSVRTLRHYHQIGLLPEPERSPNGYRLYTAADLVRVLRVRRLADFGVSLNRIDPTLDVEEELALLDRQYARQIRDLEARRRAIQEVRAHDVRADTPAYARHYVSALSERDDLPAQSAEAERNAAVLLAHLTATSSTKETAVFVGKNVARLVDAAATLLGLADDAHDGQIDAAAHALVEALKELRPAFPVPQLTRAAEESLEDYVAEQLSRVQLEAVRRAVERG